MGDLELSEDPYYRVRKRTPCPLRIVWALRLTRSLRSSVVARLQGALIAGCAYVLLSVAGMIYSGNVGWADIVGIIVLGGSGIGAGLTEVRLRFSLMVVTCSNV